MISPTRPRRCAITLLELLVVLGILGVLIGLALSAVMQARAAAARIGCANNLRQIGVAMQQHHLRYGTFPSNGGWDGKQTIPSAAGPPTRVRVHEYQLSLTFVWGVGDPLRGPRDQTGSWAFALLPFVEQQNMADRRAWTEPLALYVCPGRRAAMATPAVNDEYGTYEGGGWKWGHTDYAANAFVVPNRPTCLALIDIPDGASQTILVGEKSVHPRDYNSGTWYWDEPFFIGGSGGTQRGFGTRPGEGTAIVRDRADMGRAFRYSWGAVHPSGAQFLFADGAVHLLPFDTPLATVPALLTPAGKEVVPNSF